MKNLNLYVFLFFSKKKKKILVEAQTFRKRQAHWDALLSCLYTMYIACLLAVALLNNKELDAVVLLSIFFLHFRPLSFSRQVIVQQVFFFFLFLDGG